MSEAIDPADTTGYVHLYFPPSWFQIKRNRGRHPFQKINREGKWFPPPLGVLKINTDGSSRGNPNPTGIGGVGRDSLGNVQFIFSIYKGNHTNNLMEALALLFAMEQACKRGWRRIICESDSQVVVILLNQMQCTEASWRLLQVVDQILQLSTSLECVSFQHIPKEWNGVADCLAKWASEHLQNWYIVDMSQLSLDLAHRLDNLLDMDRAV